MVKRRVAVDDVAEHNRRMWDRLSAAGIPYTRPQGTPPKTAAAKRRFLDPHDRLAGMPLKGARVLVLAGGGGWHAVLFAELGAETTVADISTRQLRTVRELARTRGTRLKAHQLDMRDLSRFADGSFDVVWHSHSLVFVPDPDRVIAEVARVLAPGGVYRASTMHPVTYRMYGTWTGTGWNLKRGYFEDGPIGGDDGVWEFDDVTVSAPTLEYAHRISDLVNACAAAGLLVDGLWEWSPGEISTRVPIRPSTARGEAEPGSDEALERLLPAFVEWRARKPGSHPGHHVRDAILSPPAGSAGARSPKRTARRSG